MAIKIFKRHVSRGWGKRQMKEYIIKADIKLQTPPLPSTPNTNLIPTSAEGLSRDWVFLHLEYSENDIPKQAVRALYDHYCKEAFEGLGITQMTTAYSSPKNIKDLVTKAKLHQPPGKEAGKCYSGELSA